jgi:hypothetical protein
VELLLELVLQVVIEVFGEVLLELGLGGLKAVFGRSNRSPVAASLGYLLLGGAAGLLSLWLAPGRYLRPGPVPGLSLIAAPLAGGLAMHAWGAYRRSRGHATTNLATFHGGASLLFGYYLVRVLWAS